MINDTNNAAMIDTDHSYESGSHECLMCGGTGRVEHNGHEDLVRFKMRCAGINRSKLSEITLVSPPTIRRYLKDRNSVRKSTAVLIETMLDKIIEQRRASEPAANKSDADASGVSSEKSEESAVVEESSLAAAGSVSGGEVEPPNTVAYYRSDEDDEDSDDIGWV